MLGNMWYNCIEAGGGELLINETAKEKCDEYFTMKSFGLAFTAYPQGLKRAISEGGVGGGVKEETLKILRDFLPSFFQKSYDSVHIFNTFYLLTFDH